MGSNEQGSGGVDPIAEALTIAQETYMVHKAEDTARRQKAVEAALDAGWSMYRIAALIGVNANTIRVIAASINPNEDGQG